ncbi:MAG: hypothetical protein ACK5BI_10540 [Burkholderiales bacterium]|jgi:hypothetical protein
MSQHDPDVLNGSTACTLAKVIEPCHQHSLPIRLVTKHANFHAIAVIG